MSDEQVSQIISQAVAGAGGGDPDPKKMSLEALILLINTERLKHLENKTQSEFANVKKLQDQVAELHSILKGINKATVDGKLDLTKNPEVKELLEKAKELGVDVKEVKETWDADDRERLIENIKMSTDDLKVQIDMNLQTISRLTNERYESYQMARSILKPIHDAKTSHAKSIRGG